MSHAESQSLTLEQRQRWSTQGPLLQIHRRQFFVGRRPLLVRDDWRTVWHPDGTVISLCPGLREATATDLDGRVWTLLGLAVQTVADLPDPPQQIAQSHSAEIPQAYEAWSGRWVLIGGGEIHVDASAQLGCYFGKLADGGTAASSSSALLAAQMWPDGRPPRDRRPLRYEVGYSWHTPPSSGYRGMHRLLPSQVLVLNGTAPEDMLRPRRLLPPIDPTMPDEQCFDQLAQHLATSFKRVKPAGDLWIGVSAGADSRVVLAAARMAGIQPKLFTWVTPRTKLADRHLPPRLAAELGWEHVFLRAQREIAGRRQLIREHSGSAVAIGDSEPLLRGVRDQLTGMTTGGQAFGVGKALMRETLPATVTDPRKIARQLARVAYEPLTSTATQGLERWLHWVLETPNENLDWRDRFYIEQRLAGWQTVKEQAYDMYALERWAIINSARNYALLLSVDEQHRRGARHQMSLVERIAPELAKYPPNPPPHYFDDVKTDRPRWWMSRSEIGRKLGAKFWRTCNRLRIALGR